MSKTIQNGRYKIRRSHDQDSIIAPLERANSAAVLLPEDPSLNFTGIWILTIDRSNPAWAIIESEGTVSVILQHEDTKAYLALDNPTSPGEHTNICVSSDDKQVWTINPAGTNAYGRNEYRIGYPYVVDEDILLIDNSMLLVYPPRGRSNLDFLNEYSKFEIRFDSIRFDFSSSDSGPIRFECYQMHPAFDSIRGAFDSTRDAFDSTRGVFDSTRLDSTRLEVHSKFIQFNLGTDLRLRNEYTSSRVESSRVKYTSSRMECISSLVECTSNRISNFEYSLRQSSQLDTD
ncbi:hypothetical protein EC957_002024 [Mortierella hygrophila]|uniref:Uncharacterized protein n=1 Tax=Mortierella hygrophila TaxID=979708 RepID=A0A9P6FG19_9FUNG|nr:hypothetical protein EC957_002024 [Mortierella hygrophila]